MFVHMHKPSIVNFGASMPFRENGRAMIENEGIKRILYVSHEKFLGLYLTIDRSKFWAFEILQTK